MDDRSEPGRDSRLEDVDAARGTRPDSAHERARAAHRRAEEVHRQAAALHEVHARHSDHRAWRTGRGREVSASGRGSSACGPSPSAPPRGWRATASTTWAPTRARPGRVRHRAPADRPIRHGRRTRPTELGGTDGRADAVHAGDVLLGRPRDDRRSGGAGLLLRPVRVGVGGLADPGRGRLQHGPAARAPRRRRGRTAGGPARAGHPAAVDLVRHGRRPRRPGGPGRRPRRDAVRRAVRRHGRRPDGGPRRPGGRRARALGAEEPHRRRARQRPRGDDLERAAHERRRGRQAATTASCSDGTSSRSARTRRSATASG